MDIGLRDRWDFQQSGCNDDHERGGCPRDVSAISWATFDDRGESGVVAASVDAVWTEIMSTPWRPPGALRPLWPHSCCRAFQRCFVAGSSALLRQADPML
jgi:hypothetical protein